MGSITALSDGTEASRACVVGAGGLAAVTRHRAAFVPDAPQPAPPPPALALPHPRGKGREGRACFGKAVLFAKADLTFPADGPWDDVLRSPPPLSRPPAFADIPRPGTRVGAGRPVLSFFVTADEPDACLDALRRAAADLDRRLFGG